MLVYTTPPLQEDAEVVGPITAKPYAATSARDTDWIDSVDVIDAFCSRTPASVTRSKKTVV